MFTLFITFMKKVLHIYWRWRGLLKVTVDLIVKVSCQLFYLLSGKGKKSKNEMSIETLIRKTVLNIFYGSSC